MIAANILCAWLGLSCLPTSPTPPALSSRDQIMAQMMADFDRSNDLAAKIDACIGRGGSADCAELPQWRKELYTLPGNHSAQKADDPNWKCYFFRSWEGRMLCQQNTEARDVEAR